jgi:hypothetical protein
MDISKFFDYLKVKENIKTTKGLYDFFGGKRNLRISLRRFYQIENGKEVATLHLANKVCEFLNPSDQKTFLLAYFSLALKGQQKDNISLFISGSSSSIPGSIVNPWEKRKTLYNVYSKEQLSYLNNNIEAFTLHRELLLYEEINLDEVTINPLILNKFKDLELGEVRGKKLHPIRTLYKLPRFEDSPPKSVALASDFIMNHLDNFISKEGSIDQELAYSMQVVREDHAKEILHAISRFKNWVQSLDSHKTPGNGFVPIVFLGFSKILRKRDWGKND